MLELHVTDTDVTSGSIPIAWCIDKALRAELASEEIKDPAVVICIYPDNEKMDDYEYHERSKEQRFVFRLTDLMGYVFIGRPGKNNIVGFVARDYRCAVNEYLSKRGTEYESSIFNNDATEVTPRWSDELYTKVYSTDPEGDGEMLSRTRINVSSVISVDVPSFCFAKEPSKWEKSWVNHLFKSKAVDQCDFRKRRLFAYTVQPVWMLFNLFLRMLALIMAILVGSRKTSLQPLLHPLTYDMSQAYEIIGGGSVLISRKNKEWHRYLTIPLMPIFLIPICIMIYFNVFVNVLLVLLAATMIIALVVAVVAGIPALKDRIKYGRAQNELWYLDEGELQHIICDGQTKPKSVSELPSNHRTLKLRFADLKAKVCRPFAG